MTRAFTLIELLVVVTIIVVLLALLVPAMDKAIYQASLATCGANQKAVTTSAIAYAFQYKRFYPDRGNLRGVGEVRAYLGPISLTNSRASYDLRPMIRTMGLSVNKNFQCPLVEPLDLEETLPNEWAAGNQATWFGWHYTSGRVENLQGFAGGNHHRGMVKVGDKFECETWDHENVKRIKTFNLLIADWDLFRHDPSQLYAQSAHPDRGLRLMYNWAARRVPLNDALITLSYWQGPSNPPHPDVRGTLDNNFGYDDGSVRRVSDIQYKDDRMVRVPNTQSGDDGWNGLQVPMNN